MNKKGYSALGLLISIFLFGMTVLAVSSFDSYINAQKKKASAQEAFYSSVETEIASIYEGPWLIENKVIKTKKGNIEVKKTDLGITEYGTKKMKVDFKMNELNKSIEVERSKYNE